MKLFDTHCHFESADPTEIAARLERAKAAGVEKLMAVGGSSQLNFSARLAAEVGDEGGVRPQVIFALGFDRDQVERVDLAASFDSLIPDFSSASQSGAFRAVGEIGLDYHYSPESRDAQMKLFAAQLEWARTMDLPVVIHTREADDDTVALLKAIPSRGIIHCYTGTPANAKRFLDLGFFISFSGIVTFRAAENVRTAVRVVPDDRILIETDSPYLTPVPLRGQPNEPAFLRHTCEFLAKERGMSAADFAELTTVNAERILG